MNTLKPGDKVQYANPAPGEDALRFTVLEAHLDATPPRVRMRLIDPTLTIAPISTVSPEEVELARPPLGTVELMTLRAVQSGTLRRRKSAPPVMEVPTLRGLVERGYLILRPTGKLEITEDGCGALEAAEHDMKESR